MKVMVRSHCPSLVRTAELPVLQNFAQKLVSADRASLFLVDNKTNELYARIFDVGTAGNEAGNLDNNGQKEIR